MKNILKMFFLSSVLLFSDSILSEVQKNGLSVKDKNGNKVTIHRKQNPLCHQNLNVASLFSGNYSGDRVLKACSKSFVTQIGTLQPMQLSSKIKTVGELELLSHIKKSQEDESAYILIDARGLSWFEQMTIPTAMNLPFTKIYYEEGLDADDFEDENDFEDYEEAYEKMFALLNIKKTKDGLDFSEAKLALVFCNGSWCSQSPKAIYKLINIGYPPEKLLWYRGGLQDWLIYDFPVEKKTKIVYP
jgi:rhodanese-related sulfurtransferase